MERKQEIFNFSARTRLLAVRLLGLVKWASSAAKVDKSVVWFQSLVNRVAITFYGDLICVI